MERNIGIVIKAQARARGYLARKYYRLRRDVERYYGGVLRDKLLGKRRQRTDIETRLRSVRAVIVIQVCCGAAAPQAGVVVPCMMTHRACLVLTPS